MVMPVNCVIMGAQYNTGTAEKLWGLGVCIGVVERRGKGSMEVNGGKGPSPLWQWPIRSNVHSYHYPQFAGTTRRI